MIQDTKLTEILELSPDDRLALVAAIWDSLAATPARVPVPDWHLNILDDRLAADDADDTPGDSWDVVRRRIEGRA